jgi:hypothetical protein
MVPKTDEVRTNITPIILVRMGKLRSLLVSTQRADADRLVTRLESKIKIQGCGGLKLSGGSNAAAKGKRLSDPNF